MDEPEPEPRTGPPVVTVSDLDGLTGLDADADFVLVDSRWYLDGRSGLESYRRGHLPGAVFVDVETSLSGPPSPEAGRHPLPSPEHFAEAMSSLGVADDSFVVAYDDAGGVIAARLVWMLRALGHRAAILDGGLDAWPRPLASGDERRPRAIFTPSPWPRELVVSIDELEAVPGVVVDARPAERYAGVAHPLDPRAGHVPGARSLSCREHLDPSGRLLAREALAARFAAVGIEQGTPVVSYCGSGITACHNLLLLEHLGLGRGRLYAGSWSQWASDPDRLVETGADRR